MTMMASTAGAQQWRSGLGRVRLGLFFLLREWEWAGGPAVVDSSILHTT